jgi:hydrogenase expression/formation protein HypC
MALVGDVAPGEWLMTFLGAAREKMDETARFRPLPPRALDALLRGEPVDLDAAFADLLAREPLPDHLLPFPEPTLIPADVPPADDWPFPRP